MYLVSKEDLARGTAGCVEGIGGDVRDSNVNNIEVSQGGTIVIGKDGERRSSDSYASGARGGAQFGRNGVVSNARAGAARRRVGGGGGYNVQKRSDVPALEEAAPSPNELAAPSERLASTKKLPNAVKAVVPSPDGDVEMRDVSDDSFRRREANLKQLRSRNEMTADVTMKDLSDAEVRPETAKKNARVAKEKSDVDMKDISGMTVGIGSSRKVDPPVKRRQDVIMKDLVNQRIQELTGIRKRGERGQKRPGIVSTNDNDLKRRLMRGDKRRLEPDLSDDTKRRMIHDLKESFVRRPTTQKRQREDDDDDEYQWEDAPPSKREKKRHTFNISPISGKKRSHTEDEWEYVRKKARVGGLPPPRPIPRQVTKRARAELAEDEWEYARKKARVGGLPPPRPIPRQVTKRARAEMAEQEQEVKKDLMEILDSAVNRGPASKRQNTQYAPVRRVGNVARQKRKWTAEDGADYDPEMESGIPFKTRPISYDVISDEDDYM